MYIVTHDCVDIYNLLKEIIWLLFEEKKYNLQLIMCRYYCRGTYAPHFLVSTELQNKCSICHFTLCTCIVILCLHNTCHVVDNYSYPSNVKTECYSKQPSVFFRVYPFINLNVIVPDVSAHFFCHHFQIHMFILYNVSSLLTG